MRCVNTWRNWAQAVWTTLSGAPTFSINSRGAPITSMTLDLNPLLVRVDPAWRPTPRQDPEPRQSVPDSLDIKILHDATAVFERNEKMQLTYPVNNVDRAIGARISSHIVRAKGAAGFPRRPIDCSPERARRASRSARSQPKAYAWRSSAKPTTMSARGCPAPSSQCLHAPALKRVTGRTRTPWSATPASMARPPARSTHADRPGNVSRSEIRARMPS